ncbi:MAG: EVE domain-containing protein [bacterium]|nr:EVE domain-containing protein [bacterium]
MSVFVCHGSTDIHYQQLVTKSVNGWTVNPHVKKGDTLVFYLKHPRSQFVAIGRALSDAYIRKGGGWAGRDWADIKVTKGISPLHIRELREAFPEWGWPRMPQSAIRVPDEFEKEFLELLHGEASADDSAVSDAVHIEEDSELDEEDHATELVRSCLIEEGWEVTDVDPDELSYDFLCTRGDDEIHVAVAIIGEQCGLLITNGLFQVAQDDPLFVLCIVENAESEDASVYEFNQREFLESFEISPLIYEVRYKGEW